MGHLHARQLIWSSALIVALVIGASLAGCRGPEMAPLERVSVVTYRYVIDDSKNVVRVVGLVRNTDAEHPTPEAEIIATLHSRTGSFKGQNRAALPALPPGGEEQFSLAINAHGSVDTVAIEIVEPGTVGESEDDETPSDSDGESDEDGS
ncbi:MAG: hypothetical protein ACOX9R_16980 [Armatimonadota bacterium]|jgi:hypothetical protein